MYFLPAIMIVCLDVMVMSSVWTMTRTSALGRGMSAV